MPPMMLSGRVVGATTLAPIAGVSVRLVGPAAALGAAAAAMPQGQQITWTRRLLGFSGSRWDCWVKEVQGKVPGITWDQFRDGALLHNPQLVADGRVFKPAQDYLIPEAQAVVPLTWTRRLLGFSGSRWDCWVKEVQGKVPGITWDQFRDQALLYNPQLVADGRVFRPERTYLIPQSDAAPRATIEATTDAQGGYQLTLGGSPAVCELQVEVDGYVRYVLPLMLNGAVTQHIQLMPLAAQPSQPATFAPAWGASGTVRTARADYGSLPEKARRVIDLALFTLGDDAQTFDLLPANLRQMCYGARFLGNPNDFHYKDIVCADLVSLVLAGAGCDIKWGGSANPSMADYYVPDRNPKLIEVTAPNDWLPGDVLLYGPSGTAGRVAGHVNLYVGAFAGVDRGGRSYTLAEQYEVVEASIDYMSKGKEVGTGIQGRTLRSYCLDKKCYTYAWVRHVRLRELAAAYGR
ncbi:hypothetical protein F8S13_09620 [Chloroflexia bacterium SDU3-3]|nr:hypothetical protein F8S13_09620 [Chloroflexia bacterium SDU3-3]